MILVAPNDKFEFPFPGTYTPLLWTPIHGAMPHETPTVDDSVRLGIAARDGDAAFLTHNGNTISIPKGTAVCLDIDRQCELGWESASIATLLEAFYDTAPLIPLGGYNQTTWPLSDRLIPPYMTVVMLSGMRAARHYELIDNWLSFVSIRCPMRPGEVISGTTWIDAMIAFMPAAVKTYRQYNPRKQVYLWLRDAYTGNDDADYERFAKAAMVDSKSDGVVIWGDRGDIPRLLAACQKYQRNRPPVRKPFKP
jgi:hypothetical protein